MDYYVICKAANDMIIVMGYYVIGKANNMDIM